MAQSTERLSPLFHPGELSVTHLPDDVRRAMMCWLIATLPLRSAQVKLLDSIEIDAPPRELA
jgi:hypothetical protein